MRVGQEVRVCVGVAQQLSRAQASEEAPIRPFDRVVGNGEAQRWTTVTVPRLWRMAQLSTA